MSEKFKKSDYSIGLDIGTTSVGYSVIENDFGVAKYRGRSMIGAALFEAAEAAAARRGYRTARRRYDRRRERITLLQHEMFDLVFKEDKDFFKKLNDSFYVNEDKQYKQRHDYFLKKYAFKSIYHLRKFVMDADEKVDIRLIYLALHHMIKYRGNFLYEDKTFSVENLSCIDNLRQLFETINDSFVPIEYESFLPNLEAELSNMQNSRATKQANIKNMLSKYCSETTFYTELAKLLVGYSTNITKMSGNDSLLLDGKAIKVDFSSAKIDDELPTIIEAVENYGEIVLYAKCIYDSILLKNILGRNKSISDAMIARYQKHHDELKDLKKIIYEIDGSSEAGSLYYKMFIDKIANKSGDDNEDNEESTSKDKQISSYTEYIKCGDKSFIDVYLKNLLGNENIVEKENSKKILEKIANKEFLLKQNEVSNSVIPYQMNLYEMQKILDSQGRFYPELKQNSDRIIQLLTFRIPYYVGPLSKTSHNPNAWFERKSGKENIKITPWNFDEVVDKLASGKKFIQRMLNNCTYLFTEHTMPKKSLTCQKYEVVSELANIAYDGTRLSADLIKKAISELFLRHKVVSKKEFIVFLRNNHINVDISALTGFANDKRFMSSMSSYIDFAKIFEDVDSNYNAIEEIINSMAVLDGSILKEELRSLNVCLTEKQINDILKISSQYKGWSRVSRKLIDGIKWTYKGVEHTILSLMLLKGINFMQAISSKYGFAKIIDESNVKQNEDITYDDIKSIATSPQNKRGIWQAVKVIKEIVSLMGNYPKLISIEFAKGEDAQKKASVSRYEQIKKLYKDCKKQIGSYNDIISELEKYKDKLDEERYFLYFLQNGKSLYSQQPLDINNLKGYDVDHIVPRCIIKDDSFDNKALVLNEENKEKSDKRTLDVNVINSMKVWWNALKKNNLMSEKKYRNLTRINFSPEDIQGFIARQLVETRQITKHVAGLLKKQYPDSTILSIKANLVADFKSKYDIIKLRDLNDAHHAIDAYACAFLGNFVYMFMREFIPSMEYKKDNKIYNLKKVSDRKTNGYILGKLDLSIPENDDGYKYDNQNAMRNLLSVYKSRNCLITKKTEEDNGKLFKVTLQKKSDSNNLIPIRKFNKIKSCTGIDCDIQNAENTIERKYLDTTKYGGYTSITYAKLVIVEIVKKNKSEKAIYGVPLLLIRNLGKEQKLDDAVREYLAQKEIKNVQAQDIKIIRYIKIYQKARFVSGEYAGQDIYIAGKKDVHNAKQLYINERWMQFICRMNNKDISFHETANEFMAYYIEKVKKEFPLVWAKLKKVMKEFVFNDFNSLKTEQKKNFIKKFIQLTNCGSVQKKFVLESDGISTNSVGIMQITFNNKTLSNLELIYDSVTGLNQSVIKL